MLVLTRKAVERVVPGCDLAVTVIAVEGNRVRLGISAPQDVAVFREEVWREVRAEDRRPPPKGSRGAHAPA